MVILPFRALSTTELNHLAKNVLQWWWKNFSSTILRPQCQGRTFASWFSREGAAKAEANLSQTKLLPVESLVFNENENQNENYNENNLTKTKTKTKNHNQ